MLCETVSKPCPLQQGNDADLNYFCNPKGCDDTMEYRLGNSIRVKDKGDTDPIECPNCKNTVRFKVFRNMDLRLIPEYPLINAQGVYFLICPKCASIYTVDEDQGDLLAKGEKYAVGPYDLKKLKEFKK